MLFVDFTCKYSDTFVELLNRKFDISQNAAHVPHLRAMVNSLPLLQSAWCWGVNKPGSILQVTIYGTLTAEIICFAWEFLGETHNFFFLFQLLILLFISAAQCEAYQTPSRLSSSYQDFLLLSLRRHLVLWTLQVGALRRRKDEILACGERHAER